MVKSKQRDIERAVVIAKEDLRACYKKWGVFASLINFSDYWARDSFWAIFGMLEIGDHKKAKQTLLLFMKYQHKNGKISRKIRTDFNRLKYVFKIRIKRKNPKPLYMSPLRSHFSMDDNLLFVIAFCKYVAKTKDMAFAKKNLRKVDSALKFYLSNDLIRNSLIFESGLSTWMDTIYKNGHVLYTNCLWFEAIKSFEHLNKKLHHKKEELFPSSRKISSQIKKILWLEEKKYFADSATEERLITIFDTAGNSLAILFGIANKNQTKNVLAKIDRIRNKKSGLHPVNDPHHSWKKINPFAFFAGIYNYHNGVSWSWNESIIIAAKIAAKKNDSVQKNLLSFSKIIIKNNHVHETYHLDGKIFGNFFWKSAVPFAWGSGLFLYAVAKSKSTNKKLFVLP